MHKGPGPALHKLAMVAQHLGSGSRRITRKKGVGKRRKKRLKQIGYYGQASNFEKGARGGGAMTPAKAG